jgi:F-type H+-transporting ATPase subunit gamma
MSRRRELEAHRRSLGEIREIMNSMKTLAYMETRKLSRFLPAQQRVVDSIEEMAADFLHFHTDMLPVGGDTFPVCLLIGTERGFCGDFNQTLLERLTQLQADLANDSPAILAVGHKLHSLLHGMPGETAQIAGASVAEEVPAVLQQIVGALAGLQADHGPLTLYALHHKGDGVAADKLLPPFQQPLPRQPPFPHPPLLNLAPEDFLQELTDQHLFSALHAVLFSSLMAESHRRVSHLEGAVRHLDEESVELGRRSNALRQEEIIEEIEVILLSAAGIAGEQLGQADDRQM